MATFAARVGGLVRAAEENACPIGGRPGLAKWRGENRKTNPRAIPDTGGCCATRGSCRRGGGSVCVCVCHEGAGIERGSAGIEIPELTGVDVWVWVYKWLFFLLRPFAQERMGTRGIGSVAHSLKANKQTPNLNFVPRDSAKKVGVTARQETASKFSSTRGISDRR